MATRIESPVREQFTSKWSMILTMVGVAVGLGNVWRFPYMVGKFGGTAFVLFYLAVMLLIGVPALMAEWTLGRLTRRGPVGAFKTSGLPGGRWLSILLFITILVSSGYYSNTIGWVVFFCLGQGVSILGGNMDPSVVLPPQSGFQDGPFWRQILMTGLVLLSATLVLQHGLKRGIERASRWLTPMLFLGLIVLGIRAVTLPGAAEGVIWYIGDFNWSDLTGRVMAAGLGQAIFSLSLGGTFMVVYGSYLQDKTSIPGHAPLIALGDLLGGLLAGFAIFPAVFAMGLSPASGPGLIFETLPGTFALMPAGEWFGLIFFTSLGGAAFLSVMAALEVLIAGLTDNTSLSRSTAAKIVAGAVFVLAIPPMINMDIFIPWDLTFGSGAQTLGVFLAVIATGWYMKRASVLKQLAIDQGTLLPQILYWWLRLVIPLAILFVGLNWFCEEVLKFSLLS